MKRLIVLATLGLLFAACGGDTSEGDSPDTTAAPTADTTTAPASDDEPAASTTVPPDDGEDSTSVEGVGVGTVTIGDETFEFGDLGQPGLQCDPEAFGVGFLAALQSTDGNDGTLSVGIPFPGEEETAGIMPQLLVSIGDLDWMANEELAAEQEITGSSQVDSYEIDGNTISGTATFAERNSQFSGDLVVETGTFEVTCAG